MLLSLTVKNFAIIDNIQVDFKNGLTALTGETGAGKSLIIDAIGLLFGDRASTDLVRYGENKAFIEGVFSSYNKDIDAILESFDISCDDILTIKREIYQNGKSVSRINGEIVNASLLSKIANYLGDIHTQFDTMKLVNPQNYFSFVDDESINALIKEYKIALNNYNEINKEYNQKIKNKNDLFEKLDYLKYQSEELTKAKLSVTEEEELKEKFNILNNHGKIIENYQEFIQIIKNNKVLEGIFNGINHLEKNIPYQKDLEKRISTLKDEYYDLEDLYEEINSIVNHDDFDIQDLDNVNMRLDMYNALRKKYHMNVEELIAYHNKIDKEIEEITNFDFYLDDIQKKLNQAFDDVKNIGNNISIKRKNNAKKLENDLYNSLTDLELKNISLNINIKNTNNFYANGLDEIDFMVSFNKGEAMKSLAKIASGGELSRFMLALKAVNTQRDFQKTFIFDEIDTGVSGEIAQKIGEKIKTISLCNQVICVTHLPQVAAICDNHLFISKTEKEGRIFTQIEELDYNKRVETIALMLSKGNITDATIALAKELLS